MYMHTAHHRSQCKSYCTLQISNLSCDKYFMCEMFASNHFCRNYTTINSSHALKYLNCSRFTVCASTNTCTYTYMYLYPVHNKPCGPTTSVRVHGDSLQQLNSFIYLF